MAKLINLFNIIDFINLAKISISYYSISKYNEITY